MPPRVAVRIRAWSARPGAPSRGASWGGARATSWDLPRVSRGESSGRTCEIYGLCVLPKRCGRGGTRTPTSSRTLDPEPSASTNSATRPQAPPGTVSRRKGLYQARSHKANGPLNALRPLVSKGWHSLYNKTPIVAETRYIEGEGRYALAEMVGRGGFATVWRARALKGFSRGGDVAVKIIPVYSAGERSRALREGQIAEGLKHQNIVETLEVIPGDHEVYLITEYVRGMPLDEAARAYDAEEVVDALSQILEALIHAHGQGVIHRDIKPQNALVDARGRLKLTDFGVAYRAGDTRLTRVGFAVGTPGYIAPEILDGADPSALTDIYAVG